MSERGKRRAAAGLDEGRPDVAFEGAPACHAGAGGGLTMRYRDMRYDLVLATMAVIALSAVYGPAGETKQAPTYATPQAAFEAAKKAAVQKDYRAVFGALTEDNRDAFAGLMVIMGSFVKEIGAKFAKTDEDKEKVKKIETVLDKHGVTPEMTQEAMTLAKEMQGKDPAEVLPVMRKLIKPLKDRVGLVSEMMSLTDQEKKGSPFEELKTAQLKDVKVDGNTAKGKLTMIKDGTEKTDPIEFRKEGAGWKIHIDMSKKK
jgi:hypothetical protein